MVGRFCGVIDSRKIGFAGVFGGVRGIAMVGRLCGVIDSRKIGFDGGRENEGFADDEDGFFGCLVFGLWNFNGKFGDFLAIVKSAGGDTFESRDDAGDALRFEWANEAGGGIRG